MARSKEGDGDPSIIFLGGVHCRSFSLGQIKENMLVARAESLGLSLGQYSYILPDGVLLKNVASSAVYFQTLFPPNNLLNEIHCKQCKQWTEKIPLG